MNNLFSLPSTLYERYLSLPGEELLLVTRTHKATLLPCLSGTGCFGILSIIGIITLLSYFALSFPYKLLSISIILLLVTLVVVNRVIEWYFHIYIVTSRKIIEVRYVPLFSHLMNHVLLDQVRCTEVDISRNGLCNELFNMGTITITFDRPTHQEAFILQNIPEPEKVGIFLGNKFNGLKYDASSTVWYKTNSPEQPFRFTEEIVTKNPQHIVFS